MAVIYQIITHQIPFPFLVLLVLAGEEVEVGPVHRIFGESQGLSGSRMHFVTGFCQLMSKFAGENS